MKCYLIGGTQMLVRCSELLLQAGHTILGIITEEPVAKRWAERQGLPVLPCNRKLSEQLAREPFDYLFSVINSHILRPSILQLPRQGTLNFHDGPLPRYAGSNVTSWAIYEGAEHHGITWHLVAEKVDAGPIVAEKHFSLSKKETALSLRYQTVQLGVEAFSEILPLLAEGLPHGPPPSKEGRRFYFKARRPASGGILDFRCPAEVLEGLVRALDFSVFPNPLALPKIVTPSGVVIVGRARIRRSAYDYTPGTVTAISQKGLSLACSPGELELSQLTTLSGVALSGKEAALRLGVNAGQALIPLDDTTLRRINKVSQRCVRHEEWWRTRLSTLKAPNSQVASSAPSAEVSHRDLTLELSSAMGGALSAKETNAYAQAFDLLCAFVSLIMERSDQLEFDIGFSHSKLKGEVEGTVGLFASLLPLRVCAKPEGETNELRMQLAAELDQVRSRKSFASDLELRLGHRQRPPGEALPPYWRLVFMHLAEAESLELPPETELALVYEEALPTQVRLLVREDLMKSQKVADFIGAFKQRLITMPDHKESEPEVNSYPMKPTRQNDPRTLLPLIKERCTKSPEMIALEFAETQISYAELDVWSEKLAHTLVQHGVGQGDVVALLTERSASMVVGLLAILKAGAAFVPLDPDYPIDRLQYYVKASNCQIVLASQKLSAMAQQLEATIVDLAEVDDLVARVDAVDAAPLPEVGPEELAYIIFTSGSTGNPKGVQIEHGALLNLLQSMEREPGLQDSDILLAVTTISFDISILEIFLPLIVGAKVVIASQETVRSGRRLMQLLEKSEATVMQATPTTWRMLLQAGWHSATGFKILCGGEAMSRKLARQLLATGGEVWNLYGPTEATIWSSVHRVGDESGMVPIGKPIAHTEFLVLREELSEAGADGEGELYIGGRGLARGYIGQPDLTNAVFVAHPTEPLKRLYRTGDLVRRRSDGALVWLARRDYQVKIRGHRIEVGEIEGALELEPSVEQAVVIARKDNLDEEGAPQRLMAYLQPAIGEQLDRATLVEGLERRLPPYMMPALFLKLEAFPTTLNGKVDRKALPAPRRDLLVVNQPKKGSGMSHLKQERVEQTLCDLYATILRIDEVRPEDNFFLLGGGSLLSEELSALLRQHFPVDVDASMIFASPTPRLLAEELRGSIRENVSRDSDMLEVATGSDSWSLSRDSDRVSVATEALREAATEATETLREAATEATEAATEAAIEAPIIKVESPSQEATNERFVPLSKSEVNTTDLAIVGLGCRFPQARTPDEFWANLRQGRDCVIEIPAERRGWAHLAEGLDSSFLNTYGRWQGWLDDVELFDADYFGIPRREARRMDPLQRLFLTVAAETVESAGYRREELTGRRVAVFVGVIGSEFPHLLAAAGQLNDAHAGTGGALSMIANRVSFAFDWQGPSLSLDTACSSSLVALDLASKGLRDGDFDAALVGGVNLILTPFQTQGFAKAGMLSPDGRCRTFDDQANGYVRGEGGGAILVRRLEDALRDGDPVLAVIKGSAVNHDGGSKGFLTAPNVHAQVDVLRRAWHNSGITPESLSYLEAHGTGTALGDPIELRALTEAFGKRSQHGTCAIGSVKSNIGHLEPAAGIAGIIKSVLALQAGELPPTLHVKKPNHRINFDHSPFFICDRLQPWHKGETPRRVGVSSFGFGGANAHVVLEEAPDLPKGKSTGQEGLPYLLTISARSEQSLAELAQRYREFTRLSYCPELAELCITSNRSRQHFEHRLAIVAFSVEQVDDKLTLFLSLNTTEYSHIRSMFVGHVKEATEMGGDAVDAVDAVDALLGEAKNTLSAQSFALFARCCGLAENNDDISFALSFELLEKSERRALLIWLARAYTIGVELAWEVLYGSHPTSRVRLPTCPMEEVRCWIEPERQPKLEKRWPSQLSWEFDQQEPLLRDHYINGVAVLPGMALLNLASRAVKAFTGHTIPLLQRVSLHKPLSATQNDLMQIETQIEQIEESSDRAFTLQVRSAASGESHEAFAQMNVVLEPTAQGSSHWTPPRINGFGDELNPSDLYDAFSQAGLAYGPELRPVVTLHRNGLQVLGELRRPDRKIEHYRDFDPRMLDGALQCALALSLLATAGSPRLYVPFYIEEVRRYKFFSDRIWVHARLNQSLSGKEPFLNADIDLFDKDGLIMEMRGVVWKQLTSGPFEEKPLSEGHQGHQGHKGHQGYEGFSPSLEKSKTNGYHMTAPPEIAEIRYLNGGAVQSTRAQLLDWIAHALEVDVEKLDSAQSLLEQGVDSLLAVSFAQDLQERLGIQLPPTLVLEVGSIDGLAQELVDNYGFDGGQAQTSVTAPNHSPPQALSMPNQSRNDVTTAHRIEEPSTSRMAALPVPNQSRNDATTAHRTEEPSTSRMAPLPVPNQSRSDSPATDEAQEPSSGRIAIIGIDGLFPQASNPEELWENLRAGRDCVGEVPASRWNVDEYFSTDSKSVGTIYSRWGGFVDEVDEFDPQFFHLSPAEAQWLDPQQRQLLQIVWRTLERAGLAGKQLQGSRTGVFVGASYTHYRDQKVGAVVPGPAGLGNHNAILANRLSYFLDLKGPCITVDTLCSSSLVALHTAVQSLRSGECDQAIVAGVHLDLSPQYYQMACRLRSFSPQGRCRTFDAGADGFVPGEGVGVLLLKPLETALQDGNQISGVILGSAVNHGGRSSGLTVPSSNAQRDVILEALEDAGVSAESIGYVEAHGTGTSLGDPIEVEGLTAAYRQSTEKRQFCAIGSIKTNIGHLEPAAGVAGLIKVLLAFQHGELPPTLHMEEANQRINFEDSPFYVNDRLLPWPRRERARRAGISAFGMGGVNAHVILQEPPLPSPRDEYVRRSVEVVRVSGVGAEAVQKVAESYASHFSLLTGEQELSDACYTANTGRGNFRYRAAVVGEDKSELSRSLLEVAAGTRPVGRLRSQRPKVAFLFTGQGSQYAGMGRALYETEPVFRESLHRSASLLHRHASVARKLDVPLLDLLYGDAGTLINQTQYAQPALFALEYGLYELLSSWGVQPDLVIGHSVGEYVAACVAGVFTLEDALSLVATRGQLMQAQPKNGAMAVLRAPEEAVIEALRRLPGCAAEIAAVNSPLSTVVSGPAKDVEQVCQAMSQPSQRLRVSHAFHSAAMEPALAPFRAAIERTRRATPRLPLVSNLNGNLHTAQSVQNPDTWCRHLRQAVRFSAGVQTAWALGARVFWELGPRPVLSVLGQQVFRQKEGVWLTTLRAGKEDHRELLESVCRYYSEGLGEIDWMAIENLPGRRQVKLPTYPFQRKRYRAEQTQAIAIEPANVKSTPLDQVLAHPLFDRVISKVESNGSKMAVQA